ncbi:hypothetical protein HDV02_004282 [Globomyces sp. JEL0801]|nr:hypothetical protein HDV02_004282 [Globomyces sp. JEL0801]
MEIIDCDWMNDGDILDGIQAEKNHYSGLININENVVYDHLKIIKKKGLLDDIQVKDNLLNENLQNAKKSLIEKETLIKEQKRIIKTLLVNQKITPQSFQDECHTNLTECNIDRNDNCLNEPNDSIKSLSSKSRKGCTYTSIKLALKSINEDEVTKGFIFYIKDKHRIVCDRGGKKHEPQINHIVRQRLKISKKIGCVVKYNINNKLEISSEDLVHIHQPYDDNDPILKSAKQKLIKEDIGIVDEEILEEVHSMFKKQIKTKAIKELINERYKTVNFTYDNINNMRKKIKKSLEENDSMTNIIEYLKGLTVGLLLQLQGYQVTIISKSSPEDWDSDKQFTSPKAGAHWRSVATKEVPEAGLMIVPSYEVSQSIPDEKDPLFSSYVLNYRRMQSNELQDGMNFGIAYETVCINVPVYLTWLLSEFKKRNGRLEHRVINHFNHLFNDADVVINCSGMGARYLPGVEDQKVYPTRGQTVLVYAPNLKYTITTGDEDMKKGKKKDDNIKSGDKEASDKFTANNFSLDVCKKTSAKIISRCLAICPELLNADGKLEILEHKVGLRPTRVGGIRLEGSPVQGIDTCLVL